MTVEVVIDTDGACKGNPGRGGWAAVLRKGKHVRALFGWEPETTNNRMELMAAIMALETLTRPCRVELRSDSTYVLQGITEWIDGWKRRAWKKVKNVDLWQRLDAAREPHEVTWTWVRGHSGDPGNERADSIASQCAERQGPPDSSLLQGPGELAPKPKSTPKSKSNPKAESEQQGVQD